MNKTDYERYRNLILNIDECTMRRVVTDDPNRVIACSLRVALHENQLMLRYSGWVLFYEMDNIYPTNYITDRGVSYLLREDNKFMERIGVVIKTVEL